MEELLQEPVTYGCTVDDVLRLLPGESFADAPTTRPVIGNDVYQGLRATGERTGRRLTRGDVEAFIVSVATRVSARVWRLDRTPERFRENIRVMAKDLVANGAAHYVQAALYPGASAPNDGTAYADRLWQRFTTDLDALATQVDQVINENQDDVTTPGRVAWSAPAPFFSDGMRF